MPDSAPTEDVRSVLTEAPQGPAPQMTFITADTPPEVAAASTRQVALIFAHFSIARQSPRDMAHTRKAMLEHCRSPYFALAAEYVLPRSGRAIRGLSVRFAEVLFQEMKNIGFATDVVRDGTHSQTIKITMFDFERNNHRESTETFDKAVERVDSEGRFVLEQRQGSRGKTVYLCRATTQEVEQLQARAVSKLQRNLLLAYVSPEFKRECHKLLRVTKVESARKDPEFYREMLAEVGARLNIGEEEMLEYCGAPKPWNITAWPKVSSDALLALGEALESVQVGESSWWAILKPRREELEAERLRAEAAETAGKKAADEVKAAGERMMDDALGPVSAAEKAQAAPADSKRLKAMAKIHDFKQREPTAFAQMLAAMGRPNNTAPTSLDDEEVSKLSDAIVKMERGRGPR